jgi:S-DNA-T family DNA segregation ATPase FtsK/SpoIIIE
VKQNIFSSKQDNSKFRIAAITGMLLLGLIAIFFSLSIAAALLGTSLFGGQFGAFLVRAFGVMAFVIPAYLFFATFTLADPAYKADRLFFLGAVIFPLITLIFGFGILKDFDDWSAIHAFFTKAGKFGFTVMLLIIIAIECLLIVLLHHILFKKKTIRQKQKKPQKIIPMKVNPQNLRDIYTEAASNVDEIGLHPDDILVKTDNMSAEQKAEQPVVIEDSLSGKEPFVLHLPEQKPLVSKETFKNLESPDSEFSINLDEDLSVSLEELDEKNDENLEETRILNFHKEAEEIHTENIQNEKNHFDDANDSEFSINLDEDLSVSLEELDEKNDENLEETTLQDEPDEFLALDSDLEIAITAAEIEAEKKARSIALEKHASDEPYSESPPVKKRKPWGLYEIPVEGILNQYPDGEYWIIDQGTRDSAVILKETLKEFNIQAEVTGIRKGPVITMFEILPAPGVKLSRIVNLQDNIALRLAASSVRIVAPIPGKHAVGIEVPNKKRNIVSFREIIESELKREGKKLEIPVVLGKDITGEAQTLDLVQTPHLLIAGSTGSGKSVCVNSIILSILYQRSPQECRLMLIDPKIVELKLYNDIPHLLTPVITEPKKAFQALQYCIYEMERRYACLDSMGVRDIRSYNKRIKERNIAAERLPYFVVIVDEFADLMATTGKELESTVARLAAMSRAVGIHLVLATQRPSIDVITGLIKANIPSRIAFMVASKMDSRIIIDMVGAEKLLGKGDMLYAGVVDPFPVRIQGSFVSEEEIEKVVEYVKTLGGPDYIDDEIFFEDEEEDSDMSLFSEGEDPLYERALEIVMSQGKASASYIQRRLKIGYNRSARLVEEMEQRGIVGPAQGSKPRELLRGV